MKQLNIKWDIRKRLILLPYRLWAHLQWTYPRPVLFYWSGTSTYRSYDGINVKGSEKINHPTVRQCQYCENIFAKNNEQMKKHTDVCSTKEGISYCFQNGEIISFQDNFKYLGNVPFTGYFDFETTTCVAVTFNTKLYVISYCQIYSFHPSLNVDRIVIFGSFQQKADKIYDFSHFKHEHAPFFDKTTFS